MKCKGKILLCLTMLLLAVSVCQAEDNWQFVDARDDTGYYLDVSSVRQVKLQAPGGVQGEHHPAELDGVFATIAVIRAHSNKIFVYDTNFLPVQMKYQILSSKVMTYDTRKELSRSAVPMEFSSYGSSSPMHSLAEYAWSISRNEKPADLK